MARQAVLLLCVLVLLNGSLSAASRRMSGIDRSWSFYQTLVKRGAGTDERIAAVERILKRYGRSRGGKRMRVAAEKAYLYSWRFYEELARGKTADEELLATLDRINAKYAGQGIDLSPVAAERARVAARRDALHALRAAAPEPIPPVETTPAPPAAIPEEVTVSSAVAIPPPSPAPAPLRTSKHVGIGLQTLGTSGLFGYGITYNYDDLLSFGAGYGEDTLVTRGGSSASPSGKRTLYQILCRYGRNAYVATGFQKMTTRGEAVLGQERASAAIDGYGIPVTLGIETGSKRGFFFTVELSYVFCFGGASRELVLSDAGSGRSARVIVEAPESGTRFGFGIGCYLF